MGNNSVIGVLLSQLDLHDFVVHQQIDGASGILDIVVGSLGTVLSSEESVVLNAIGLLHLTALGAEGLVDFANIVVLAIVVGSNQILIDGTILVQDVGCILSRSLNELGIGQGNVGSARQGVHSNRARNDTISSGGRSIGDGNSRNLLLFLGGIRNLNQLILFRSERHGAQCQSHDHGQHSCNDLLHVCFLHKNLFVSDLTSPLSPAVYNVNIIML